jgi:hypothetical protein
MWAGERRRYSDWLRTGRSGDRSPVGLRFSAPVQTGPGAHPASCTICTGSFPGLKSCRGVTLTTYSLLVPWSWKGGAIPLLPLWGVRLVQSLIAFTRMHFTLSQLYHYAWQVASDLAEYFSQSDRDRSVITIYTSAYCLCLKKATVA